MAVTLSVILSRVNVSPFLTTSSGSNSASGTIMSPASLTSLTVYFLPSDTFTVMNMSSLSGLIDTWVESMLNSK